MVAVPGLAVVRAYQTVWNGGKSQGGGSPASSVASVVSRESVKEPVTGVALAKLSLAGGAAPAGVAATPTNPAASSTATAILGTAGALGVCRGGRAAFLTGRGRIRRMRCSKCRGRGGSVVPRS